LISKDNHPSIAWMCRICTFSFLPFHLGIDSDSSVSIAQCQLPINIIPTLSHVSGPIELLFNLSILNNSNLIGQTSESHLPISPCNYKTLHKVEKISGKLSATFTYLHVNARSFKRIFFSLGNLFAISKILLTAITVSETWLSKGKEVHFSIPEYTFVSVPREIGRGGVVGIYIHDSVEFRIKFFSNIAIVLYKCVIIEIVCKGCPNIVLGC